MREFRILCVLLLLTATANASSLSTPIVDASYYILTFGLPSWAEIMIGFAIGTPIQGMKLFFPFTCVRNILDVFLESFDFYIFYESMIYGDATKNQIYAASSLVSIALQVPQIFNNCISSTAEPELARLAEAFSDSIMDLFKTFVYIDTAFNMLTIKEYILSGYFGMYSLLNIVEFIAFFSLNT